MYQNLHLQEGGIVLPSKKKCLSFFLIILFCFGFKMLVSAQSSIQGTIWNESNMPVVKANVFLMRLGDSTQVSGSITNEHGKFSFTNISGGTYFISVSAVGFNEGIISSFRTSGKDKIVLKPLQLSTASKNLEAIVVEAKKPLFEQKIDRLIINVKSSVASSGATALEILEQSPGVAVDRHSNSISMNGRQGVVIMINGKVSNMPPTSVLQMLSGMNAGTIEKIELLTTPPSNYDAEGAAGFINIVLVQNASMGTMGTFAISAGYGRGETSAANLTLHHRKGKLYVFGDYSFSRVHQHQVWHNYRKVLFNGNAFENSTEADRDPVQRNHNIRLGLDYQPGKKTIFGGVVAAYDNRWSMLAKNKVLYHTNGILDTLLSVQSSEINQWKHLMGNLHVQHQFNNDSRINTDVDYLFYRNVNPTNYLNTYYDRHQHSLGTDEAQTQKQTPISMWVIKSDYSRKLNTKLNFEAGFKHALSLFENDVAVSYWEQGRQSYDPALTAVYRLRESVTAAYTSLAMTPNEKTDIKAGLRYEYSFSNLGSDSQKNIVDRRYGNLFPTLFVSRKLGSDQNIAFSYSRRINRPSFNDIAPFVIFLDRSTYFSGNPALQPSITDAIKGDYSFRRFLFSLSYSHEANAIARWQSRVVEQTNKQFIAAENFKNIKTLSATFSLPLTLSRWWSMQNSLIAMGQQVNTTYKDAVQLMKESFQFTSSQLLRIKGGFSVEVSGYYRSKILAGTYVMKPRGTVNIGVQRKFNQGRGVLSFAVNDMFVTNQWRSYIDLPAQNLVVNTDYLMSQRTFRLSYTLKFGKADLKTGPKRVTGSEEDQKRVN